jgi:DNA-binding NarL/FixJ family response regulator
VTAGAGTILQEKEAGTFKRLLIAPLPPIALLGGKMLAQFIQTLVQLTVLFALGALLFHINLGPSIPALALIIVGTSFAATGLGMILVSFIQPSVASKVLLEYGRRPSLPFGEELTEREREVLDLLSAGASNREIAEKLVLAEGTVKNHVSNILGKLHAANRTHAVALAREQGLI